MSKHPNFLFHFFSITLALVIVFFIRLKIFPNSPIGSWEREWLRARPIIHVLEDIQTNLTWLLDNREEEIPLVKTEESSLHFLYENIAEKNIRESFIRSAFDDCVSFDETWKKEKCSDAEKNTYIFADYTLTFSIATWSLYYTRDPTSSKESYEAWHIKIYVKDLSGLEANVLSRIDKEFMDTWVRPWYIQTRILSDYWPIGLWWWVESQNVYDLPEVAFPKADASRVFMFFGGQEYPLSPYVGLLFKKDAYLVGMFSYGNKYLPHAWQEKYFNHFQQENFLNDQNNYSYFVDYLKKDPEFSTYIQLYLQKIFKILEIAE